MDLEEFLTEWHKGSPTLTVHTSGSTGTPKELTVEKQRMEASARTTCTFLGLREGDSALLCLPMDYIAGKMMAVRAIVCGLRPIAVPPDGHPLATANVKACGKIDFAAMVPLQVWNSLQVEKERQRLMAIRHLIIGGGPVDDALASELRTFPNAVWSTYGMTETLSHIALRRLSGTQATEWYTPLKGVTVGTDSESRLIVDAPAVCPERLVTNDIAELRQQDLPTGKLAYTDFRIIGRRDNVICSGGLKIYAEEVERMLKSHISLPFCITKRKDERLGEAVVLVVEAVGDNGNDCNTLREELIETCRRVLPRHWVPRSVITTDKIPTTGNGKVARYRL